MESPAGGSPDNQIAVIQRFDTTSVDGIALSEPGASPDRPIDDIIESGILLETFNMLDPSENTPHVGERSVECGHILDVAVMELLGGNVATGVVRIGKSFHGLPVPENHSKGVRGALDAVTDLENNESAHDVTVDPVTNHAAWEALVTANSEINFVADGYDLTAEILTVIERDATFLSIGRTPFMQGNLPAGFCTQLSPAPSTSQPAASSIPAPRSSIPTRCRSLTVCQACRPPSSKSLLRARMQPETTTVRWLTV